MKQRIKSLSNNSCARKLAEIILLFFILHFSSLQASNLVVDSKNQTEINHIKSAYIYNFLKYVSLNPTNNRSKLNHYLVCTIGAEPFGSALDVMEGKMAKGIPVKIKRVEVIEQLKLCHIVYISQSENKNLLKIFHILKNLSILTVSDIKDFTHNGGIIGFIGEQKKIEIEINLANARQSKVQISALLLEIARIID